MQRDKVSITTAFEEVRAVIRRARVADAETVHAVLLESKDAIGLISNFASGEYIDLARGYCRQKQAWIAAVGESTAGVLVLKPSELSYLAVVPAFRRQGVGRSLLRHAININRKRYGKQWGLKVEVLRTANVEMISLLVGEGFQVHPILKAGRAKAPVYYVGDVR